MGEQDSAIHHPPSKRIVPQTGKTPTKKGVDYPRLLEQTDIVWTEEGNDAGISPEGVLVSKIRSYKTATGLGNKIFSDTFRTPLAVAEAMACNRGCLGMKEQSGRSTPCRPTGERSPTSSSEPGGIGSGSRCPAWKPTRWSWFNSEEHLRGRGHPGGFLHAGQKRSRFSGTRSKPSLPSTTRIN